MIVSRVRGMRDFVGQAKVERDQVGQRILQLARSWGYEPVETPTLEYLELFQSKVGTSLLDAVFSFEDRAGRRLILSPELTAPTTRLMLSQLVHRPLPLRLCYLGSCYRYENPQHGRYRQFTQFGTEIFVSAKDQSTDAIIDLCLLAAEIFRTFKLRILMKFGDVRVIHALVQDQSEHIRQEIYHALDRRDTEGFERLCERFGIAERFQTLFQTPQTDPRLTELQSLVHTLQLIGIDAQIDLRVIRGLDYYSGIVFEAFDQNGSQILGGGEYTLFEDQMRVQGLNCRAIGFGIGFDRLINLIAPDWFGSGVPKLRIRIGTIVTHLPLVRALQAYGIMIVPMYETQPFRSTRTEPTFERVFDRWVLKQNNTQTSFDAAILDHEPIEKRLITEIINTILSNRIPD